MPLDWGSWPWRQPLHWQCNKTNKMLFSFPLKTMKHFYQYCMVSKKIIWKFVKKIPCINNKAVVNKCMKPSLKNCLKDFYNSFRIICHFTNVLIGWIQIWIQIYYIFSENKNCIFVKVIIITKVINKKCESITMNARKKWKIIRRLHGLWYLQIYHFSGVTRAGL